MGARAVTRSSVAPEAGDAIEAYLAELVVRLRAAAGDRFVGAWLFGSGALGDFDPARSDLDVQAVTSEPLSLAARRRLAERVSHAALACPVRGLELVLYGRAGLTGPSGPAFQLNLNDGPRMSRHVAFSPEEDPRFWFVLDVAIGREVGRPLAGPPAAEVFPDLPRALVLVALGEALDWHGEHDPVGASTVLAACRAWAWAEDGRWLSKGDAARWADARGHAAVVRAALARRADPTASAPDPDAVAALLAAVRRALAEPPR
jgi:hypothetical protein